MRPGYLHEACYARFALKHLPKLAASFATGELSYSKVRVLTRVANRDNEEALLAFALRHTASQVADRCRELRMGDVSSADVAERAFANRGLFVRRNAERGVVTVTVELPLEAGELIDKALDKARDDECLEIADLADTSWRKRQADAFVTMLNEYLAGNGDDDPPRGGLLSIMENIVSEPPPPVYWH